ncbi:MAG TPA: hypothetical protein VKV74_13530 [Bryobacteraceae bacterium]|nr:hypothetical protein [Bryobacteraceae bacterium]
MKTSIRIASLFAIFAGMAATAITPARITRPALRAMEKSLDDRIDRIWPDNPLAVVGLTRAVYLEGFGAVFTAEVSLAYSGISPMHAVLTPPEKAAVTKTKNERVPQLKTALEDALVNSAASLDPLPANEQVVIEVILDRYDWEDKPAYPAEMIVQATKQKLLEVKAANGAGMAQAVRVTEH